MDKRANRLYELRKRKKTSQIAVGLATHISQSRISMYEHGDSIPSNMLIIFADYYKVSIDYILKRSDDKICISNTKLSIDEQELLLFYRHLETEYKKLFEDIISAFKNSIDG